MSVQSQIDRINQNVANTYAVLAALGADMPTERNSDNLAATAGTAKAVLYSAQALTEAQQEQARQNIGINEAYKAGIVAAVIESLGGNPVFGYVDEDNNIIVSGNLPDGTYSVKYELEDGSTVEIGDLVLDTNVYYTVTNSLTNCTSNNSATQAVQGGSYSATITAVSGYELKSVTVTMGGSPVTVSGGVINIANVTGNIVITAVAEEIKASYTNLATTFLDNSRFNSSGTTTELSGATACMDYIPFTKGAVVRVKGFGDLTFTNSAVYSASKAVLNCTKVNSMTNALTYAYDSATGIVTLTCIHDQTAYIRVAGKLTGDKSDVIITVDEPIV